MSMIFSALLPSISHLEEVVSKLEGKKKVKEERESAKIRETLFGTECQLLAGDALDILSRIQYLDTEIPLMLLEFVLRDLNLNSAACLQLSLKKLVGLQVLKFDSSKSILIKCLQLDQQKNIFPNVHVTKGSVFQACEIFIKTQQYCEPNYRLLLKNLITAAHHVLNDSEPDSVVIFALVTRINNIVAYGLGPEVKPDFEKLINKLTPEDTISTGVYTALGQIYHDEGDCDNALDVYDKITSTLVTASPGFSQDTSRVEWECKLGAASVLLSLGRYQEAWSMLETLLEEQESKELVDEAVLLKTHAVIASVMSRLGRFNDALEVLEHVGGKQDPESQDGLWTRHHIAINKSNRGESHEALSLYDSIYVKLVPVLGAVHTDVLGLLVNKALAQKYVGEKIQALHLLKQVLKIRLQNFGEHHPETLRTLINIAEIYIDLGRLGKSFEILNDIKDLPQLVRLRVEFLRVSHSLCLIQHKRESFLESEGASGYEGNVDNTKEPVLDKLYKVFCEARLFLGIGHPFTLRVAHNAASVFATSGSYDIAIELYDRVKTMQAALLGETHPEVVLTEKNIYRCNKLKRMAIKTAITLTKDGCHGDDTHLEILEPSGLRPLQQSLFVL